MTPNNINDDLSLDDCVPFRRICNPPSVKCGFEIRKLNNRGLQIPSNGIVPNSRVIQDVLLK